MAAVIWAPEALRHLASIHSYVRQHDEQAADRLIRRLQMMGNSLHRSPHRGRLRPDGTRELVTIRPYVIRYEVSDTGVTILAVRHSRRRPI